MARLGELERKVMDVLWESLGSEKTVRQVAEELPNYAYTTILTVLDRLQRKHMVRRTKDGRAHRYAAAASREAYTAELMLEALGAAPDRDAVLVRFAEVVSSSEASVLRHALDGVAEEPATPTEGSEIATEPKAPA
jgi:predicted transcriptional regulator